MLVYWIVTPKSVPPKVGPAGPILAKKPAKSGPPGPLLLPKSVRSDQFWQPKLVRPCQFWSPRGADFGKKLSAKISPPQFTISYTTL